MILPMVECQETPQVSHLEPLARESVWSVGNALQASKQGELYRQ